jgi:hypothetical protein
MHNDIQLKFHLRSWVIYFNNVVKQIQKYVSWLLTPKKQSPTGQDEMSWQPHIYYHIHSSLLLTCPQPDQYHLVLHLNINFNIIYQLLLRVSSQLKCMHVFTLLHIAFPTNHTLLELATLWTSGGSYNILHPHLSSPLHPVLEHQQPKTFFGKRYTSVKFIHNLW